MSFLQPYHLLFVLFGAVNVLVFSLQVKIIMIGLADVSYSLMIDAVVNYPNNICVSVQRSAAHFTLDTLIIY